MHNLHVLNTVTTTLTLLANLAVVVLVLVGVAALVGRNGRRLAARAVGWGGPRAYIAALLVAAVATLGSLYYSEVIGFIPCTLCWAQRICMYSAAALLALGLVRRDHSFGWCAAPFVVVGAGVALGHLLLEGGANPLAARPTASYTPCAVPYFRELGFITLAYMDFSAFLLIAGLLAMGFAHDRSSRRRAAVRTPLAR